MREWPIKAYDVIHEPYQNNNNYGVHEHWLAGLISQECAMLDPLASRFESHVFASVDWVANGNKSKAYPGFNSGPIKAYIDRHRNEPEKLRALATSYGLGQIMGYNFVNKWGCEYEEFTNLSVERSIKYTLKMMGQGLKYSVNYCKNGHGRWGKVYEYLLRWWNTGSLFGKTYHDHYVPRAHAMAKEYQRVMASR